MNERVSIIIPAYNVEKEIERCVKSVLAQTYQEIQVIIVNDGSTDGTLDVLRKMEQTDSRITVIDKINEGVTKARLTGVENSSGEWIGFVDGDDFIEPEMYERLVTNAHKFNADISHCGYQMVFPSRVDFYYNTGNLVKQDKETGLRDLLLGDFVEPGLWNKLFRKALFARLLQNNRMDESIKNFEDLLMNYYLFEEAKTSVFEDFCPYHYIVRASSAANSNPLKLKDWIKVTDILIKETEEDGNLYRIMKRKLIRQLIAVSSQKYMGTNEFFLELQTDSIARLRKYLLEILFSKGYGYKLKAMAFVVCLSPQAYGFVHRLYQRRNGLDKKYDIT